MPFGMIVRPTTQGAHALDEFLQRTGQTLHAFCETKSLDYAQAHRNMSGARGKRVSVDFAAAIEAATDGAIPARLWCQGTLGAAPDEEEPVEVLHDASGASVKGAA